MKKKDSFKIGLYYGALTRKIRKALNLWFWDYKRNGKRGTYKRLKKDLRYANTDLLVYLNAVEFNSVGELIVKINDWLELEAKANGYHTTYYTIGQGKNIFYKIEIERELMARQIKRTI